MGTPEQFNGLNNSKRQFMVFHPQGDAAMDAFREAAASCDNLAESYAVDFKDLEKATYDKETGVAAVPTVNGDKIHLKKISDTEYVVEGQHVNKDENWSEFCNAQAVQIMAVGLKSCSHFLPDVNHITNT